MMPIIIETAAACFCTKEKGGLLAALLTSHLLEPLVEALPQGFEVQVRRTSADSLLLS
jgi:hypothetical protein